MICSEYSNSIDTTERTIAAQAGRTPNKPMTFVPARPSITISVGNSVITMSFGPQYYIQTPEGTRTFNSRLKADLYFAAQVRRARFWAGFDAYCRGLSLFDLHDPDEQRGYWAANSAQAETEERHEENLDAEWHSRGMW